MKDLLVEGLGLSQDLADGKKASCAQTAASAEVGGAGN